MRKDSLLDKGLGKWKKEQKKQQEMKVTHEETDKERDHKTLTESENIETSKLFKVTLTQ